MNEPGVKAAAAAGFHGCDPLLLDEQPCGDERVALGRARTGLPAFR
jgi:hypothetical protein